MLQVVRRRGRGLLVLTAVTAVAVSACGGSSSTQAPTPSSGSTATISEATATPQASLQIVPGSQATVDAMAALTSYKFKMTQAGTDAVDTITNLTGEATADGTVAFTGTIVLKPARAADVTTTGLQIIFVDGNDYMDVGGQGFGMTALPTPGPSDGTGPTADEMLSQSDEFTPAAAYAALRLKGYAQVGTETKNGVECDHYQPSTAALAEFGSFLSIKNATWAADIWLARDGGYPVSLSIVATAKNGTIPYEVVFDLSNINDPANKVTAPENVIGA
jgi:hypothetical protein